MSLHLLQLLLLLIDHSHDYLTEEVTNNNCVPLIFVLYILSFWKNKGRKLGYGNSLTLIVSTIASSSIVVLCIVYCVLCIVYCVHYCVLCIVYCVLCDVPTLPSLDNFSLLQYSVPHFSLVAHPILYAVFQ